MPSSSADIFNQVRSAVDIVEVIGEHVALKRAGREFKGLCPFHPDHRPSMAVVPHKQIFHCFVCGTGGDVFKFVKEFHKMGNGEALRMLAQRAGIKLPELPKSGRYPGTGNDKDKDGLSPRERIANTNEWACTFFEKHLHTPSGKLGLDYLHSRGLTDETITRFRLGMSPDGWTGIVNEALRLQQSALTIPHLAEAGLIKQRQDSSPYDAFRNRVIFPIIDATGGSGTWHGRPAHDPTSSAPRPPAAGGRVIAFGGRILEEKRDEAGNVVEAKYLNSPDSKLFNKSESLYGLNLARQHIIRTRTAIVVEGYMDVIACHQAGVTNVIATLGTALTPDHARILKNYAQTIVLVFDSDDAGRRAADRAMEVFVKTPLDIKIAAVSDGKDPCDYCMKFGGEAFQRIVDDATDAFEFQWKRLKTQVHGTQSVTARQDIITQFLAYASASMEAHGGMKKLDPIRRGQLIIRLSSITGLSVEEITDRLFKLTRPTQSTPPSADTIDAVRDAGRWTIGCVLSDFSLFSRIKEHFDPNLFPDDSYLQARLLYEYSEQDTADNYSLAGFLTFVEENEANDPALHASLYWERKASIWIELSTISPALAVLVQRWQKDLGHTPARVVEDCLQYLIDLAEDRMRVPNIVTLDDDISDEEMSLRQNLEDIAFVASRNQRQKSQAPIRFYRRQSADSQGQRNFEALREAVRDLPATGS